MEEKEEKDVKDEKDIDTSDPISSVETSKEVPEESKPKTSVFVANLPRSVKIDGLMELFKDFEVESALVAIKRK